MKKALNKVRDKFFEKIHGNNLVYNTCWEDPKVDRILLELDKDSEIVMITSAGCNALDYLLDDPKHIYCIDVNPRQNALLNLKQSLFKNGDYNALFKMFGVGQYRHAQELLEESLKDLMPTAASDYWEEKIAYFLPKKNKKSFYFRGTSGSFAWVFKIYLDSSKKARKLVDALLEAQSLEEQQEIYAELEPSIINKVTKWLMDRHVTMSMLGVPHPQRQLIRDGYPGGMSGYIRDNLKHIFTELPITDNYFWRLYITGRYTKTCCPNYLKEENYSFLQGKEECISTHTTYISSFLKRKPGQYSHYILLDHQDWLASHDVAALEEEWMLILENSKPGTKILMRSAALEIDFIPDFVLEKVSFDKGLTAKWHKTDRVGTYGSTYLGTVK
ncbi:BtaA family protein [Flammeovirgaceae bacterium SG7u.111]|nr:BtaA family protein [Flammeovirgaceae bacterium SG7u.132]WPO34853.1 BtaA family protein [Flammeovirgaceae bacterium SG7u.111]